MSKYNNMFDKNEIVDLYNSGKSVIEIANEKNTDIRYIYRFMKFHKIKLKTLKEAMASRLKTYYNSMPEITKDKIMILYKDLSMMQIAKKLNISICYLQKLMKKYHIEKKLKCGKNNPNWKNGVMYDRGRKLIYCPEHPHCNFLGKYVYEYRLVMEKKLGRYLELDEIVHHIDGDVNNNIPENLEVMPQSSHASLHTILYHRYKNHRCKIC